MDELVLTGFMTVMVGLFLGGMVGVGLLLAEAAQKPGVAGRGHSVGA